MSRQSSFLSLLSAKAKTKLVTKFTNNFYVSDVIRVIEEAVKAQYEPICTHPCIQMHNSPLSPGPHGRDFENYLWQVVEVDEMELDQEWRDSQEILIKNQWLGQHAANCRPKALECDMATSFIDHITHEVLDLIVTGDNTLGCNIYYVEKKDWLSIIPIYTWTTMIEHTMTVRLYVMSASTERQ